MDESFLEAAEQAALTALEEARKKLRPAPRPEGFDGTCACGAIIPAARVELGYFCCVPCQTATERAQRVR